MNSLEVLHWFMLLINLFKSIKLGGTFQKEFFGKLSYLSPHLHELMVEQGLSLLLDIHKKFELFCNFIS